MFPIISTTVIVAPTYPACLYGSQQWDTLAVTTIQETEDMQPEQHVTSVTHATRETAERVAYAVRGATVRVLA